MTAPFCGCGNQGENESSAIEINSCHRESLLDAFLPLVFFMISCTLFGISRYRKSFRPYVPQDYLRLPTSKTLSVFRRSLLLLIFTLLEISCWAFLFAWRLESAILERTKNPDDECHGPPLYQVVDPGLAFIPRLYILVLVIKSFTTPADPLDPSKFTRYSHHFLIFYSITFVSALVRVFDYFFTDNNWFISSSLEKSFASIDVCLCFGLWYVTITSPSELDQGELVDFEEDDDGVLVLQDGRVVRNGRLLSLESSASPLASLTFSWMNSLLSTSFKHRLNALSLWTLPMRQRARENYRLFAETSHHPIGKITSKGIIQRLFQSNRHIVIWQFITAIAAVLFHYAHPFFLLKLLNFIQDHQKDTVENEMGYVYCLALFTCNLFSTLVASQTLLWGRRWHVTITHMLNSEIYAHALRLKRICTLKRNIDTDKEETEQNDDDKLHHQASLMSQDTDRLAELASYLHIFYTCPLEIAAGALFLYHLLGNAFLAGLVVMAVALPSTHHINRRLMFVQTHLTDAKTWRIRLLRELCEGIKTIKFLATERTWEQAITNAREDELVKLIKLYTQNTILSLIWYATPVFVTTISFAWYTLVEKKTLDASTAFVSIVLFGMLRDPLNVMPQAFVAYTEANLSLRHITTFLNTEEKEDEPEEWHPTEEEQSQVSFDTSTFEWTSPAPKRSVKQQRKHKTHQSAAEPILGDSAAYHNDRYYHTIPRAQTSPIGYRLTVNAFQFPTHALSLISGPPQSGKSSMLAALLGHMPLTAGNKPMIPSRFLSYSNSKKTHTLLRDAMNRTLYLNKVAFVSQTPWIEHGTVRENILFSEPWDDTRYRAVLHQCDLLRDLSLLENGDLTLIGERNSGSISECMQHRISLARAVYSKAKTVIIDDIFSPLGKVASTFIYENCICGDLMKMRTVIVVATYPDKFWCSETKLFVHLDLKSSEKTSDKEGYVKEVTSEPDRIMGLIEYCRQQKSVKQQETDDTMSKNMSRQDTPADVIDALFDGCIHPNLLTTFSDDEFFDESSSIIPASFRREEEEKAREYAYAAYFSACGGWKYWGTAVLFTLLARLASISENYWLKIWSMTCSLYPPLLEVMSSDHYVLVYLGLCLITVGCNFIRTVIQYRGTLRASNRLFLGLLQSVCHAPLQFFDITPVNQIMDRFSKDMETVDSSIGWHINFLLQTACGVLGVVVTIGFILPEFFIASLVAGLFYFYIGIVYIRASKELKKLNADTRPPIFYLYTDTLEGLATIRAYGEEWTMMKKMFNRLDDNMRPFYTLWTTNRWLFIRVELLGTILSLFISTSLVRKIDKIDAGLAGIALTFSTSLLEYVYWLMRQSTTVDMHFEAIERINEYMEMPQEPPSIVEGSRPPAAWPTLATVQVRDLTVSFSNSESDAILKHISFHIQSGQKVALIGRANAEKYAVVSCLFRFMEPMRGSIKIDGVNIAWIGVEDLRSRITFISKDGWLLSGTARSNLDPFGEYDDYALWQALYRVKLAVPPSLEEMNDQNAYASQFSSIQDLDKDLGKEGSKLPVVERQLLCIARAILQDCTKLVILEEAHLSNESEGLMRSVIEQECEESTLLVIPYRLHDIMKYDKVLIFDQGNLVECDSPVDLLNKQHSLLQSLCDKAGILDELTLDMDIIS